MGQLVAIFPLARGPDRFWLDSKSKAQTPSFFAFRVRCLPSIG